MMIQFQLAETCTLHQAAAKRQEGHVMNLLEKSSGSSQKAPLVEVQDVQNSRFLCAIWNPTCWKILWLKSEKLAWNPMGLVCQAYLRLPCVYSYIKLVEAGNTSTVEASCSQVRMCANLTPPLGSNIPQKRGPWLGQGKSKSKHVCPHIGSWPTDESRVDIRSQDGTIQRSAVDGSCSRLSRPHVIAEGIFLHKSLFSVLVFLFF